ncbi:MAG: TraR/DksA C4-type zinc finger protein [Erythrobacter sp.]|jgi:phage/conjugal plasmid C-4 type zinc finger TraR family protein
MSEERGLERAEDFQRQQDELRVARIRARLETCGDEFCRECGDPIEEERRVALPSAICCVACQNIIERRRKGLR